MEKIEVRYKNKTLDIDVKRLRKWEMGIGLMFRTRKTKNLLFAFNKDKFISLTACFVFFPFLVLWLDDENRVIEKRVIYPFELRIFPKKSFRSIIEIPFSKKNKSILKFFDEDGKI